MAPFRVILLPEVFAASRPGRLESLALLEPAWAGRWNLSRAEQALWEEYDRPEALAPDEFMRGFMRLNVKSGVELPSPPAENHRLGSTRSKRRSPLRPHRPVGVT